MSFDGIPLAALDFYEDLEADNTKAFWTAHKHVYDEPVKAPLQALAEALAKEFGTPKFFRPYRDVRFSKDKTPYKTHQGIWFGESSMYLHVSAAGLFVAGGYWDTDSAQVDRLRRAIADDVAGHALQKALASVRRKGFEHRRPPADPGAVRLRQGPPARRPAALQDADRAPRVRLPGLAADAEGEDGDRQGWKAMAQLAIR